MHKVLGCAGYPLSSPLPQWQTTGADLGVIGLPQWQTTGADLGVIGTACCIG